MSATYTPRIMDTIGLSSKKFPEINKRIEILGDMNDRHKVAMGSRDKRALRQLAKEYQDLGCVTLANEIRAEARAMRRRRSRIVKNGDAEENRKEI